MCHKLCGRGVDVSGNNFRFVGATAGVSLAVSLAVADYWCALHGVTVTSRVPVMLSISIITSSLLVSGRQRHSISFTDNPLSMEQLGGRGGERASNVPQLPAGLQVE